jgi:hypothetical protein
VKEKLSGVEDQLIVLKENYPLRRKDLWRIEDAKREAVERKAAEEEVAEKEAAVRRATHKLPQMCNN